MRMLVFEGTVEEIKELQRELLGSGATTLTVRASDEEVLRPSEGGDTPNRSFVQTDVALRFLTRRALSREQRLVISAIYRSHPVGVLASELQDQIDYSTSQFAGLMGAFGRRLVNTQGYVEGTWFFDNQWEPEHECNRYRFPDSVRRAVAQAGLD